MEMKQNQTFFHGTYSNLALFFIGCKILKHFNDFYNWLFSISFQKWPQTIKVTRDMCKSDSIFPYLRSCTLFNDI